MGSTSLIYGQAEMGKTSFAIQSATNACRKGYKTIFIDSDSEFSAIRLSQIAYYDFNEIAPKIVLVRPTDFQEQIIAIDHLDEYLTKKVILVIVDTITSLYRIELGAPKKTFLLNRELTRQVAYLNQIAKTHNIAILMISQVRSIFTEKEEGVSIEPVATRVLRFWSDIVLSLNRTGRPQIIRAVLEKSSKLRRPTSCLLKIGRNGIRNFDQQAQVPSTK